MSIHLKGRRTGVGVSVLLSMLFPGAVQAADPELVNLAREVASGSDVTLPRLLAFAAEHAPLLALDEANEALVRAARAAAGPVVPDNPQLEFGAGAREQGGNFGPDFQVGISQRFEVAGERRTRLRVADAVRDSVEAVSHNRHWDLHTAIHALFYRAIVAGERVALAQRVVAFQTEIATIVGKQRRVGQVSQLAERVTQAESLNAEQTLSALVQAELAVRQELALVTGWSVDAPPRPRGSLGPIAGLAARADLVALAGDKHPYLGVLDATIMQRRAELKAADRDSAPEPTFGVRWSHEASPGTGSGPPSNIIFATVGVPLPFFFNNGAARAEAAAQLAVAQAERRRLEAEIAAQVTRAYGIATAATQRLETFGRDVLPRFEENLAALKKSYELGEIDILGLASGRERFLEAHRAALTAQEDYFTALAELENAVGVDVIDVHSEENE